MDDIRKNDFVGSWHMKEIYIYIYRFEGWDHFGEEKSTFFGEKSWIHFRGKNPYILGKSSDVTEES